jgi:Flp pilus assembly protein TadG
VSTPDRRTRALSPARWQSGTAATEFIVALPLLLVLFIGISEFGRLLYQYNAVTKSTRDAARYLASHATGGGTPSIAIDADDIDDTRKIVVYGNPAGTGEPLVPNLNTSDVTVSCLGGGTSCPGATHIQVTTQYSYQPILRALIPTFGRGADIRVDIPLTTSTVMSVL